VSRSAERRPLRAPQLLLVALLACWALADVGAGFVALFGPISSFGLALRDGSLIVSVAPGSPAAEAGLRPGERVLIDRLDPATRARLIYGANRTPVTVDLPIEQDGKVRLVRVTSASAPPSPQAWSEEIAATLVTLAFVGVGVGLVLLRPTRATWSFLFLATGYPIVQLGSLRAILPVSLLDADAAALGIAMTMTLCGTVAFITGFPDQARGARTRRYAPLLYASAVGLGVLFFVTYATFTGSARYAIFRLYEAGLIATLAGLVALILGDRPRDPGDRARGRWVLAGSVVAIGGVALGIALRLAQIPGFRGSALDVVLGLAPGLLPVSVAYAVLKQRVIDVRFAINRALVFGAFTSVLVVVFSFAEFVLGKIEEGRVAQDLELIAAIVVGFSFNLAHKRIEGSFERVFFRSQHEAAARLRRVSLAIPHAEDAGTVDRLLTREPAEAFDLVSATIYRRENEGDFRRVAGIGWRFAPEQVSAATPLVAFLSSELWALELDGRVWNAAGRLDDAERPILAVPIAMRNVLIGFACYGPQRSGEAFDPAERQLLYELAGAAAGAYVHLAADALRREVASLRATLASRRALSS